MDGSSSIATVIAQIGLSGIFLWLYLIERKAHDITRQQKDELLEKRRSDAAETRDKVTGALSGISQTLDQINTKIIVSKDNRGN